MNLHWIYKVTNYERKQIPIVYSELPMILILLYFIGGFYKYSLDGSVRQQSFELTNHYSYLFAIRRNDVIVLLSWKKECVDLILWFLWMSKSDVFRIRFFWIYCLSIVLLPCRRVTYRKWSYFYSNRHIFNSRKKASFFYYSTGDISRNFRWLLVFIWS